MPISLSGSLNLSGSLTTTGTITATTLVVQTITSSISSITGSTNFGSLLANTHTFTGSLNVTGGLAVTTTGVEFQVNPTGVNLGNALTDSHVISGSLRINSSTLIVSSSGNVGIGTIPNTTAGITELAIGSSNTNPLINGIRDGASAFALSSDSAGTLLNERRNLDLRFSTNNTEKMRISGSGLVGIGTSTPVSLLNIHSGDFTIQKNAIGNSTEVGNINFRNDYMGPYTWAQIKGVNGANHDFSNITFSTTNGFNSLSEKVRITPEGYLRLAGAGIQFNGDTAAANSLDDYEEGTWTPTWNSGGGTINTNTSFTSGTYTKIGNVVHIWARLYTNSVSSPTGVVTVSGLPFTVGTQVSNQAMHLFTMNAVNATLTGTPTIYFPTSTSTGIILNKIWDSSEFGGNIATYFDNDTWGYFYGIYIV